MDKAIIFGVYDFVSFQICKTLLNKGIEVYGVNIEDMDKVQFLDEKRFEVGRNSNFIEHGLPNWEKNHGQGNTDTVLIFSLFDSYMQYKDDIYLEEKVTGPILNYIKRNNSCTEFVFILPIQLLGADGEKAQRGFLNQVKGLVKKTHFFYLPSIYGPWQTETFIFQQVIMSDFQRKQISKSNREWTIDTIFVEDAIDSIFEIMDINVQGSYVLESGKKNYWDVCASYLKIEQNLIHSNRIEPFAIEPSVVKIPIKKITPISDSFLKQKNLADQLYGSR
ncbi:hypothetical protein ACIFOT_12690 [Neobacillus sp. NRS-1170]|uniref:hypothetical protein n=1 Tax=Neobacillus sp. NRS-1170 TaxID=3233898 RepID=UPI003D2B86E8